MVATPEDYFVGRATELIAGMAKEKGHNVEIDTWGTLRYPFRARQRNGVLVLQRNERNKPLNDRWVDVDGVLYVDCGNAYQKAMEQPGVENMASAVQYAIDHPEIFKIHHQKQQKRKIK